MTAEERKAFYNEDYFKDYGGFVDQDGVVQYSHADKWKLQADKLFELTGNPRSVLDCGCAVGMFVYGVHLFNPAIDIKGIDISPYAIEHAIPEIRDKLSVWDMSANFRFDYQSVDLVTGFDVLEHLHDYNEIAIATRQMVTLSKKYIFLRMPMTEFFGLPDCKRHDPNSQKQVNEFIESLNRLPHKSRLALIGTHPDIEPSVPDSELMEHPNKHPHEFWIGIFESQGFEEVTLSEEHYLFPNVLNINSFNCLLFRRRL